MSFDPWLLAPVFAVLSVLVGFYFANYVSKQSSGTARMKQISDWIREGAMAFLKREYTTLAYFAGGVAVLLLIFLPAPIWSNPTPAKNIQLAIAYIFGAVCSGTAGYLGMNMSTRANAKAANAALEGLNKALLVGFRGGGVMGLMMVGLGLLGVSIVYGITRDVGIVLGFSFGASSLSLIAKAGGGIYTKTADMSADLVGKVELGIPEDDPRNPAVIADNVGDNVGDVAGMGADLFDSYVASIVAAMIIGAGLSIITNRPGLYVQIAFVFSAAGALSSVIGALSVRVSRKGDPGNALNMATYITCVVFAALTLVASLLLHYSLRIWVAAVFGLAAGVVIGITSDYFTSGDKGPVLKTAEASKTGPALTIVTGFSYGLNSVLLPLVGIGIAAVVAYKICEPLGVPYIAAVAYAPEAFAVYGIAMAALGLLSIVGLVVASDAFGPVVDNARGIAEQAGLGDEVVAVTDQLDEAGNTAKAITKGFAIGAAGLTVIALLAAFEEIVRGQTGVNITFDLMNPLVLFGILVGLAIPALFSAMVMLGVGRNTTRMIAEIQRQFREIPGLKEGKEGVTPDYAKCVDIAAVGALHELLPPSIIAIITTLLVGFVGGIEALGGYLAGSIFSGLLLALIMSNAGGLWDNAKKLIESGEFGGKGSDAHKAAVIGDTVGDPFKDTAGPSLNTLITVMALMASLFATLIARFNLLGMFGIR